MTVLRNLQTQALSLTRRSFIAQALAGAAGLVAACTPAPTSPPRQASEAPPAAATVARPPAPAAPTTAPAAPTTAPAAPTTAPAAVPAAGKVATTPVTVALSSDVLSLDPSQDITPIGLNVFKNVFSQLTDIRADGTVGPLLAESWESKDSVTWTFKLRNDARFHNGQPVTADDVLWTYEMISQDAKSPARGYTAAIEKIDKLDERTVRFSNKYPYAPFPRQVSLISILPRAAYQSMGPQQFGRAPIGSGPYKVRNWAKDDRLELEAFDQAFGGAPAVKSVVFRPVPSESSRVAGLESGDLDIVALLPPPEVPRLRKVNGIQVDLVDSNRNVFIGVNVNTPPLDNLKVRQAIDVAINREQICRDLLDGMGKPVGQPIADGVFGFDPSFRPSAYDPERARQLLKEAGFPNGVDVDMQYATNRVAFLNEVAQAVTGQLGNVGIRVKLEGMEYAALFPLRNEKKIKGLYLWSVGPSIMDADLALDLIYDTRRNYWLSDELNRLIQKQRGDTTEAERLKTIQQIWKLDRDNVAYSWLYTEVQAYGTRDRVVWKPRKDERFNLFEARLRS